MVALESGGPYSLRHFLDLYLSAARVRSVGIDRKLDDLNDGGRSEMDMQKLMSEVLEETALLHEELRHAKACMERLSQIEVDEAAQDLMFGDVLMQEGLGRHN